MAIQGGSGVRISGRGLTDIQKDLELLTKLEVLVGFPEETTDRDPAEDGKKEDLTNAALGYIHDNGAPEANIPQREFMVPGIQAAREKITDKLGQTMKAVLRGGGEAKIEQGFTQVGLIAANSIKRTINEGIPPPLSDRTLRARMKAGRKNGGGARKGAAQELDRRWDGQAPSLEYAKPLVDTAQMRNAVTFVIRKKKG